MRRLNLISSVCLCICFILLLLKGPNYENLVELTVANLQTLQGNKMQNNKKNNSSLSESKPDSKYVAYEVEGKAKRFPGAIIIGAMKCGTAGLATFLTLHPSISRSERRAEHHFFNNDKLYHKGVDAYRQLLPISNPGQITIEKTPEYFVTPSVPERVQTFNSSVKLLLIVRDPTKRLVSEYAHHRLRQRNESRHSFEELVFRKDGTINEDYIRLNTGLYHVHYRRWLKYFPKRQIHVVDGEKFSKDPLLGLQKVEQFLGLKPHIKRKHLVWSEEKGFHCMKPHDEVECLTRSKGVKHPTVSEESMEKIRDFYRPHNDIFETMLGYSFNWG